MAKGNSYFHQLKREYVFPIIEKKLEILKKTSSKEVINLGIGDVALPLAPSISSAIQKAALDMSSAENMQGYGPSQGHLFLREAIASHRYSSAKISAEEIFISDGINTDIVNILDLFHSSCFVAIPDPSYPAYSDSNILLGRKNKIVWMPCTESTGFVATPPSTAVDIVYLCSPHNPTGVAMTRKELTAFVSYAKEHQAILLYDNAYEAFISSHDVPKTIYEIPGAEEVAIEFCSFSKSAGFTGLRCSYLVLPHNVKAFFGKKHLPLHPLWLKRQSIKFNGTSYPIQKGAEACFSPKGKEETQEQVRYYLKQASTLKNGLTKQGHTCFGGVDAPYIWWKIPKGFSSWEFFDLLLSKCHLLCIPGSGFGKAGEGFVRLSAFTNPEICKQALESIQQL